MHATTRPLRRSWLATAVHSTLVVAAMAAPACSGGSAREAKADASAASRPNEDIGHVAVRVVDAQQRAVAGAPVFLESRAGDITWILGRAKTRDDGIANVPFRKRWVANSESWGSCEWIVRLGIPGKNSEEIPVDPTRPSVVAPQLTLPPVGSVVLRLVDAHGAPFRGDAHANLAETFPGSIDVYYVEPRQDPLHRLVDGRVRFEHVPLDQELYATVWIAERSMAGRASGKGPAQIGEEIEMTISVPETRPFIAGRVLDSKRAPVADATLVAWFVGADIEPELGFDTFETDRDGRFRFELPHDLPEAGVLRMDLRRESEPNVVGDASIVEIPRGSAHAVTDLGDVVLQALPVLASGIVVDEDDRPVEDASVSVDREVGKRMGGLIDRVPAAKTNASGRFEIRGPVEPTKLEMTAYRGGSTYLEAPVTFTPPTEGLVIRLRRAGRVEGAMAIPEGTKPYQFQVIVERMKDGDQRVPRLEFRNISPTSDGRFWRGGLPPGRYSVGVSADPGTIRGWRVDGVEVRAGETTNDPRLQRVELQRVR